MHIQGKYTVINPYNIEGKRYMLVLVFEGETAFYNNHINYHVFLMLFSTLLIIPKITLEKHDNFIIEVLPFFINIKKGRSSIINLN